MNPWVTEFGDQRTHARIRPIRNNNLLPILVGLSTNVADGSSEFLWSVVGSSNDGDSAGHNWIGINPSSIGDERMILDDESHESQPIPARTMRTRSVLPPDTLRVFHTVRQ